MNLYLSRPPRQRPCRIVKISPGTAFAAGVVIGMMLPMWIKIVTK